MQHSNSIIYSGSSGSSFNGSAFDAQYLYRSSFQATFTDGTSAGTLKVQASNDNLSPANWSDVPNATVSVTAGGVVLIPLTDMCFRWIRLVWTKTGGSGTMIVNINSINI